MPAREISSTYETTYDIPRRDLGKKVRLRSTQGCLVMLPDCSKEHDVGARTQYKWFAYAAQSRGLFSSRIAVTSGFDGAVLIL